ncbi:MAG: tetratricopeptide repeat protein [Myxococcales bacterium]|nr:tetratricopeptide repeat protein [Myxococcales bacterium]MCB9736577.1 tetratricopeptide repeat protein [Deltaproteobacteria bacterium]
MRGWRALGAVAVAGLVAVAGGLIGGACGETSSDDALTPEARAGRALDAGDPLRAVDILRDATEPRLVALRGRAQVARHRWSDAEQELTALGADPAAASLRCDLAVARRDVASERLCKAAIAADPADLRAKLDLARALDDLGRPAEGEKLLRDLLVDQGDDDRVWAALVDHYEHFGWIREAVDTLATWRMRRPFTAKVGERLAAALRRKVRGDLLEKRWLEASVAARWLLAEVPSEAVTRFYLADALDGLGKKAEAEAERKAAEAAGAKKPPPVNAPRELSGPPDGHEH